MKNKRQSAWRGYGLRTIAVGILVVAFLLTVAITGIVAYETGSSSVFLPIPGIVVATPLIFFSLRFLRRSRRHFTTTGDAALAEDPRPPVVYLRAFTSDSHTARVDTDTTKLATFASHEQTVLSFIQEWRGSSEEEYWTSATSRIGPAIAIGAPGQLPYRGAARLYVSDGEWQGKVLELIGQASLVVVLGGGGGGGLSWEIEQVSRLVPHERQVFLLPNNAKGFESLRSVLKEVRHMDIGEKPRVTHKMNTCALLRFNPDGTHEMRPVWGSSRVDVAGALKPVLDRLEKMELSSSPPAKEDETSRSPSQR
jgi:hypothetical protein